MKRRKKHYDTIIGMNYKRNRQTDEFVFRGDFIIVIIRTSDNGLTVFPAASRPSEFNFETFNRAIRN